MEETSPKAQTALGYTRSQPERAAEDSARAAEASSGSSALAPATIAIIGAGPRGTSLLERLGAHLGEGGEFAGLESPFGSGTSGRAALEVHVIDDAPHGAGRIWRTDQHRDMCMNTLSHAVTLFTEPGSTVRGPVREGPTLYEWTVLAWQSDAGAAAGGDARLAGIPDSHVAAFAEHPVRGGLVTEYRDELAEARPESHPSRALYGEYLTWAFERALSLLPQTVRVVRHFGRAEAITENLDAGTGAKGATTQRNTVLLDTGERIGADAVILATGWMRAGESQAELDLAAATQAGAVWVRQESPIEQPLSQVEAGEPVIVRGLGMSFFDTVALLTIGRGGEFVEDPSQRGGLRYIASGNEPIVHATSGRGVPFRSKSLYGGLPPAPAQKLLRAIDWANEPRPINFDLRLWPRIAADAFLEHAATLERLQPGAVTTGLEAALVAEIAAVEAAAQPHADGTPGTVCTPRETVARLQLAAQPFVPNEADRFDLLSELNPAAGAFDSPAAYDAWIRERVAGDLAGAELGRDSAFKAGLWSVSAARSVASRIGTLGGYDAESRKSGQRTLHAVGGMAGSGPPAFRNRQLLALQAAGIVHFIGPAAEVRAHGGGFVAESPRVAGSRVEAPALVDAWMHFHSLDWSGDPLALQLLADGRARSYSVAARAGGTETVGGFDLDPATGLVVHADGTRDESLHVAGIPADQTLHDTVISPMPGTDPPMLRETDRVTHSALTIALRASAAKFEGALNVA